MARFYAPARLAARRNRATCDACFTARFYPVPSIRGPCHAKLDASCLWPNILAYPAFRYIYMMSTVARIVGLLREHSGPSYKSGLRQLFEVADLLLRGHIHPSEYFLYGLSLREVTREQMGTHMSNRSHWQDHLGLLNDPAWFALMDNRRLFHLHFQDLIPLLSS